MIVIYCQHADALTSAERRMVAGMRDLPGLLLVNALVTTGRRVREIDGIWIRPQGVVVLEAKGTGQAGALEVHGNGPWRIGGEEADFPSGPNPLQQARTAAQTLRSSLSAHGADTGFLPAVVAVAGPLVRTEPTTVGDMVVLRADDLVQLPALLSKGRGTLSVPEVQQILDALDVSPDDDACVDELLGEGFQATPTPRPAPRPPRPAPADAAPQPPADRADSSASTRPSSKDRRRARRLSDLEAQAHRDWRSSHRRRLVASWLGAGLMVGYLPHLPVYCLLNGLLTGVIAGAYQLAVRRRKSGPRDQGARATALWILTLLPFAGVGASLSWIAALPALAPIAWPFVMMLAILIAAGLTCAVVVGRSAFVHAPAIVLERYDEHGRPTGAFMLAQANPLHFPSRDWRTEERETFSLAAPRPRPAVGSDWVPVEDGPAVEHETA